LNVSCNKDPPLPDDFQSMPHLRMYVQEQFAFNRVIEDIAHHLVASSFYVAPASSTNASDEIRCRLAPGEIQALGIWLSGFRSSTHKPYFVVRKPRDSTSTRKIALPDELVQSMTRSGEFTLQFNTAVDPQTTLEILLCLKDREHMISGFPRIIGDDKTIKNKKRSQSSLNGPPSPVLTRSKTPILPLGTYSRPSKLEDWDPTHFNDPKISRKRLAKSSPFFSPDNVGFVPVHRVEEGDIVYEMEGTTPIPYDRNEVADTSIRAVDSELDSSSGEE